MEYMTMGSLCDLLLNESYPLEADVLLLMLRDIVQGPQIIWYCVCRLSWHVLILASFLAGMRFLHTAAVPVVHGDLKSVCLCVTDIIV